jgi:hypothetical protein
MMEKQIWIKKKYNKNFNQEINVDIWMTKFGPYFQKSQLMVKIMNLIVKEFIS